MLAGAAAALTLAASSRTATTSAAAPVLYLSFLLAPGEVDDLGPGDSGELFELDPPHVRDVDAHVETLGGHNPEAGLAGSGADLPALTHE